MIDGLQPREHAPPAEPLEVILADVEHRGAQVELVKKLRDEDVHLQHARHVLLLHIAQHVDEPFEVAVRGADPEEVDLFAGHAGVAIRRGAEDQVVEDGGVGGDADAAADHHRHLELVPVLVAAAEGALDADLWRVVLVLLLVVDGLVEAVAQLPCPGPNGLDVNGEEVLVGR
jgi:hypothetical protein